MILQALQDYYQRKLDTGDPNIAPFGFQQQDIPFILDISLEGELIQPFDTREGSGRKKKAKSYTVPQGVKKTSGVATNLLWDNVEYVLGLETKGDAKRLERVAEQHQAFIDKIQSLPEAALNDAGIQAVLLFLEHLDLRTLEKYPAWEDFQKNPNISFRISGETDLVCERFAVVKTVQEQAEQAEGDQAICLLTGKQATIERLHTVIKGVWGAQTSGANIVSVNNKVSKGNNAGQTPAFASYGKQQGFNAPMSQQAVFAYTTGLNHLLRKGSRQRMQVGDTSTVFWAEKEDALEQNFVLFFSDAPKDDPDQGTQAVKSLYESVKQGQANIAEDPKRFYVLGLAPNAARIAIRFWHVATVKDLSLKIYQHFVDLEIDRQSKKQLPHLPLFRLLLSIATLGKADNIPPNLAGETIRCILEGLTYPHTLLSAAIRRNRAERDVSYPRAALIKACLNRQNRHREKNNTAKEEELSVSLDPNNINTGYRLGRLFAILEKIQQEAQGVDLNATIRDRYYGAASSTPQTVFPTLLKLKNHHLSKMKNKGRVTNLEKLLGEVIEGINDFPATLKLEDQGRFAIGYYHQRQNFFKRKEKDEIHQKEGVGE